jgi:hypothetical protein
MSRATGRAMLCLQAAITKAEAKDMVEQPEGPGCTCRSGAGKCELHGAGPFQERLAADSATIKG